MNLKESARMEDYAAPLSSFMRIGLAVLLGGASVLPSIGAVVADAVDYYPESGEKATAASLGGSGNMLERRESFAVEIYSCSDWQCSFGNVTDPTAGDCLLHGGEFRGSLELCSDSACCVDEFWSTNQEIMGPPTHLSASIPTLVSIPSTTEGTVLASASASTIVAPKISAPTIFATISPSPMTPLLAPLTPVPTTMIPSTPALITLSPTSSTFDTAPTILTPSGLLLRALQEDTETPSPTSWGDSYEPSRAPTSEPTGSTTSPSPMASSSTLTLVPTGAPTSSPSPPSEASTSPSSEDSTSPSFEPSTSPSSEVSPSYLTPSPEDASTLPPSPDGEVVPAKGTAIATLALAVIGIIIVSGGSISTSKTRESGDGRGSSSAEGRRPAPPNGLLTQVSQNVILPGVDSGGYDGEERASTRRPTMTLAVILVIQLQLLATLSLVDHVTEDDWLGDFVDNLRIINFWWSFDDDSSNDHYLAFEDNASLVSGIFLGIFFLHITILSGVEASWLTKQRAKEILTVTNCYDRSASSNRMPPSFRKARFTRRTSPQLGSEGSDGPRYSSSKRLTSATEGNSSDEEKGIHCVRATHRASELGPVETCRKQSNSAWLYFPHVELEFLLIAFNGSVASQAWAIKNSSSQTKVFAVTLLVLYPILVVAAVCRSINVRVRPNTLLVFNACDVNAGRSVPNGHGGGFLSRLKTSWSENDGLFSWADKGQWETVEVEEPRTRRAGDRFRIGFEPIFVDYTKSGVWFLGFFLVQWAATACVGVLLMGHSVWQLSLFCGLQASTLVVLIWLKPFVNSVVNTIVTCLVVINVVTFALLAISTDPALDGDTSDLMFKVVTAVQFLGLCGLVILIYLDVAKVVWGTIRKIQISKVKRGQLEDRELIRVFTRRHWFSTWCTMICLNLIACVKDTSEGMRRPNLALTTVTGPDDSGDRNAISGADGVSQGSITTDTTNRQIHNTHLAGRMHPNAPGHFEETPSSSITALEGGSSGKKLIQQKIKSEEDERKNSPGRRPGDVDQSPRKYDPSPSSPTAVPEHIGRDYGPSEYGLGASAKGITPVQDLPGDTSLNKHNAANEKSSGKELIHQGPSDRAVEFSECEPSKIVGGELSPDPPRRSEDPPHDASSLSNFSASRTDPSGKELIQQGPNKSGRDDFVPVDSSPHVKPGLSPQLEDSFEERLPFHSPVPQGIYTGTSISPNSPSSIISPNSGKSMYISNSELDSSSETVSTLGDVKVPSGRRLIRRPSHGINGGTSICPTSTYPGTVKLERAEGDSHGTGSSGSVCMDSAAGSKYSSSHSQDGGAKAIDGRPKLGHTVRQTDPLVSSKRRGGSIGGVTELPHRRITFDVMTDERRGIWPFHLTPQNPVQDSMPRRRSSTSSLEDMFRGAPGGIESSGTAQGAHEMKNAMKESSKRLRMEKAGNGIADRIASWSNVPSPIDCPRPRQLITFGKSSGKLSVSSSGRSHVDARETEDDPDRPSHDDPFNDFPPEGLNVGWGHKRPVESDKPCRRRSSNVPCVVESRVITEHEQNAGGNSDGRAERFELLNEEDSAPPDSAVIENNLSGSGSGTEKEGKIASW